MNTNEINKIFSELAQYTRLQEETASIIEGLKNQIKDTMTAAGVDTLTGSEHKAIYKAVESSRLDSKALKADAPEVYNKYVRTSSSMRFTFN